MTNSHQSNNYVLAASYPANTWRRSIGRPRGCLDYESRRLPSGYPALSYQTQQGEVPRSLDHPNLDELIPFQAQPSQPGQQLYATRIVVASSIADTESLLGAWQQLSDNALEPNAFYEPFNLVAAITTLMADQRLQLIFIFDGNDVDEEQPGTLIGFFPFTKHAHYCGAPIRVLELLGHRHCYLSTPLVHRDYIERCLAALSDWFATQPPLTMLSCRLVSGDTAKFMQRALVARGLEVYETNRFERAFFDREQLTNKGPAGHLSKKSRKGILRQRRRLAELGKLEYRELTNSGDPAPWITDFLDLEKKGWKGHNESALACREHNHKYFLQLAAEAHKLGKLDFCGFYLDNLPIALSCKFRSGNGRFAFKIAFNEDFGHHSPGLLLELDYLEATCQRDDFLWLDSCAEPEHPMADRIWPQNRELITFIVSRCPYGNLLQRLRAVFKKNTRRFL